jgi:hypothetical protein
MRRVLTIRAIAVRKLVMAREGSDVQPLPVAHLVIPPIRGFELPIDPVRMRPVLVENLVPRRELVALC